MRKHKEQLKNNQKGFASLVIGLVLIIVLALITIGFANLTRNEQKQALSKQLATQANYAAETGINDAVKAINSGALTEATPKVDTGNCLDGIPKLDGTNYSPIVGNGVSYSCAMVSLNTTELIYNPVSVGASRSMVASTSARPDIRVEWTSVAGKNVAPTTLGSFGYASSWNAPAVIQFSITPLSGTYDRDALRSATKTFYFTPYSSGGTVSYSASQGRVVGGACAGSATCHVTITGIPSASAYLMHYTNLYDTSSIKINGTNAGNPVTFSGAQAKVDVTGKARNVLKRLQVRVPVNANVNSLSNYAIEAREICKRIVTTPVSGGSGMINVTGGNAAASDACNILN